MIQTHVGSSMAFWCFLGRWTRSPVAGHFRPLTSCQQGTKGKENELLLENLVTLGVDLRMVRRRQPGVLKKCITNEKGLTSFLLGKGASRETVASIINRFPRAITRSREHMEERWDLWRRVFRSNEEIVNILERSPESFFRSSDNENLEKNIVFLGSLGLNSKDLYRLLTTAPRTFSNSLELNQQMVELLKNVCLTLGGEDPAQFVKGIISRNLYVLICSTKRISNNIDFVKENLKLSNEKLLHLLRGPGADVLDLSNEYLISNFKNAQMSLQSLGCESDDVKKLVSNHPAVLCISPENFRMKTECLRKGGVSISQIIDKPKVLEFSLANLRSRLAQLHKIEYDFQKQGISILDYSQRRFEAKLARLATT